MSSMSSASQAGPMKMDDYVDVPCRVLMILDLTFISSLCHRFSVQK